jgi:hypothetical protein
MGTLGKYLQDARVARKIELREAAQQTRINAQYLRALEEEDFSKLPGDVFVKGFLKSYGKFLQLDEQDVMQRYTETRQKIVSPSPPPVHVVTAAVATTDEEKVYDAPSKFPLEPVLWAVGIVAVLILFLFSAFPKRQQHVKGAHEELTARTVSGELSSAPVPTSVSEKLYLEVVALENTWLLIRTDASPQKKAMLNKGESLIWSADERFLLSYGKAGDLKLVLNGNELVVDEPKDSVIRDLVITSSGIVSRKIQMNNSAVSKTKLKTVSNIQTSPSVSAPVLDHPQRASAQPKTSAQIPQKPVQ